MLLRGQTNFHRLLFTERLKPANGMPKRRKRCIIGIFEQHFLLSQITLFD